MKNASERQLKIIINGTNLFLKYIENPSSYVDCYYLWDMICSGILNQYDEKQKLNLVIIERNENDLTEHIHLICPSPGFSNYRFDINDPVILLYKEGDKFQPIFHKKNKNDTKNCGEKASLIKKCKGKKRSGSHTSKRHPSPFPRQSAKGHQPFGWRPESRPVSRGAPLSSTGRPAHNRPGRRLNQY